MTLQVDEAQRSWVIQQALAAAAVKKRRPMKLDPELGDTPEEMEARLQAMREDMGEYSTYVHGMVPQRHHRFWIDLIQQTISGQLPGGKRKLLLLAPPGSAKSTYSSLIFPPWYLGNHPDHQILFVTASDDNADRFGTTVRVTLEQNERHALVFPTSEARPNTKRGWSGNGLYLRGAPAMAKDPSYLARGYGAKVIGARLHGIVLDDPIDQVSSESEAEQRKAKSYFDRTLEPRLIPDEGWVIAIMTRWHELDLASHFIPTEERPTDWHVVVLPMEAGDDDPLGREPGELLWPDRFSAEYVEKEKRKGLSQYNCIWQCDPTGLGGEVFRDAKWFRPLPADFHEQRTDGYSMRDRLMVIQAWDLSHSEKSTADYTVGVTMGVDSQFNLYLLDVFRKQVSSFGLEDAIVGKIVEQRPHLVVFEEEAFKAEFVRDLLRRIMRRVMVPVQAIRPVKDKIVRARLPAQRAEAGMFFADKGALWWEDYLGELLGFPLSAHDDQVDATSLAVHAVSAGSAAYTKPRKMVINPDRRGHRP